MHRCWKLEAPNPAPGVGRNLSSCAKGLGFQANGQIHKTVLDCQLLDFLKTVSLDSQIVDLLPEIEENS